MGEAGTARCAIRAAFLVAARRSEDGSGATGDSPAGACSFLPLDAGGDPALRDSALSLPAVSFTVSPTLIHSHSMKPLRVSARATAGFATAHQDASWTAPAKRSDDGAFDGDEGRRLNSGVAACWPPQAKIAALHLEVKTPR